MSGWKLFNLTLPFTISTSPALSITVTFDPETILYTITCLLVEPLIGLSPKKQSSLFILNDVLFKTNVVGC